MTKAEITSSIHQLNKPCSIAIIIGKKQAQKHHAVDRPRQAEKATVNKRVNDGLTNSQLTY